MIRANGERPRSGPTGSRSLCRRMRGEHLRLDTSDGSEPSGVPQAATPLTAPQTSCRRVLRRRNPRPRIARGGMAYESAVSAGAGRWCTARRCALEQAKRQRQACHVTTACPQTKGTSPNVRSHHRYDAPPRHRRRIHGRPGRPRQRASPAGGRVRTTARPGPARTSPHDRAARDRSSRDVRGPPSGRPATVGRWRLAHAPAVGTDTRCRVSGRRARFRATLNAELVWECLLRKNMTQRDLAARAQISPGYLSQLLSGKRSPSACVRARLQAVLEITEFEVLFRIEDAYE